MSVTVFSKFFVYHIISQAGELFVFFLHIIPLMITSLMYSLSIQELHIMCH